MEKVVRIMGTLIGISFLLLNFICGLKSKRYGVILYLLFSFVSPVIKLGPIQLSYDLVGVAVLLLLVIVHGRGKVGIRIVPEMIVYIFLWLMATVLSAQLFGGEMDIVGILGMVRLILLLFVLLYYGSVEDIKKTVYATVLINLVVMVLQYITPNSAQWTYELFAKDRGAALAYFAEVGQLGRFLGTFNNPLPAAYFMLNSFILALSDYHTKHSRKSFLIICVSCICGIMTASKTFIVGFPLCLGFDYFFNNCLLGQKVRIFRKRNLGFLLLIVVAVLFFVQQKDMLKFGDTMKYYLGVIMRGDLFVSRFGEQGALDAALEVFRAHWMTGVGGTTLEGEFIGDSQYVVILHDTGIIGMGVIGFMLVRYMWMGIKWREPRACVLLALMFFVGFAGVVLFSSQGMITFAMIILLLYERQNQYSWTMYKSIDYGEDTAL